MNTDTVDKSSFRPFSLRKQSSMIQKGENSQFHNKKTFRIMKSGKIPSNTLGFKHVCKSK